MTAGRRVIPGSIYRVAIQAIKNPLVHADNPITIRAALIHNYHQVTSGKQQVFPGFLNEILLKVSIQ